jgi:hypothetical protein
MKAELEVKQRKLESEKTYWTEVAASKDRILKEKQTVRACVFQPWSMLQL